MLDISVINQKKFQREKRVEDKIIFLAYSILKWNLRIHYRRVTNLVREKFENLSSSYQRVKEKKIPKHLLDLSPF
jgi:hypothetical protein